MWFTFKVPFSFHVEKKNQNFPHRVYISDADCNSKNGFDMLDKLAKVCNNTLRR